MAARIYSNTRLEESWRASSSKRDSNSCRSEELLERQVTVGAKKPLLDLTFSVSQKLKQREPADSRARAEQGRSLRQAALDVKWENCPGSGVATVEAAEHVSSLR